MFRFVFVSIILLIGGCANAEYTPTPGAARYTAYGGEVQVLSGFPAEGSFERLGILVAKGVRLSEKEDLIEKLKKEAADRGANAIVLQGDVKIRRGSGGSVEQLLGAFALRLK